MRPPVRLTTLVAALLLAQAAAPRSHAAPCRAAAPLPGQSLAHPVVTGAAGPFPRVTLALTRPAKTPEAPFTGTLAVGQGTCLALAGPDLPADFFLIDVKAVLFTRLGREAGNGIVILYDSSQIGPGNGTDHAALVYRVSAGALTREPALEQRLDGVQTAAQARARLAKGIPQ